MDFRDLRLHFCDFVIGKTYFTRFRTSHYHKRVIAFWEKHKFKMNKKRQLAPAVFAVKRRLRLASGALDCLTLQVLNCV